MKLSILICSVPTRMSTHFRQLLDVLLPQATKDVEVVWLGDNYKMSVGEKRNNLLSIAKGKYVTFVDDDDMVSKDYVAELLRYINGGADIICFNVNCSLNGGKYKRVDYDANFLADHETKDAYKRLPNHICCVKREIALQVGFLSINMGEDSDYAKRLKPLIKTQSIINKVLYNYDFSHTISETQ